MHTLLSREHATHLPGRFAGLWRALGRRGRAGDRSSEHLSWPQRDPRRSGGNTQKHWHEWAL